ncbi:hypothetical protein N5918_05175, partial [Glaesserella parasuis]|nr:hypothetical protein [Glaesserella parasuis]
NLNNILSNNYIRGYDYPYALAEQYRANLPSRWSLLGTNKSEDEKFYSDIVKKYENRATYDNSFNGRVAKSTAEGLSYLNLGSSLLNGGKVLFDGGKKLGEFAAKYPKATEGVIAGTVSTGYDLYNGNATPEKTMMNFVVGRALAGKSWDQQLSGNLIYKGIVSIDENKSANEVALGQMGVIGGTAAGGVADILLNLVIKNNAAKQIISNSISGYTENSIDNIPVKKDDKQEGGK